MTAPGQRDANRLIAALRHSWIVVGVVAVGLLWVGGTWAWEALVRDGPRTSLAAYLSDLAGLAVLVAVIAWGNRRSRQIQDRLEERESQLTQLLHHSPDAIVVIREGLVIFANAAAARLVRAPDSAWFMGRPVLDLIHPDDRGRQMANLSELRPDEPGRLDECRILRADGSIMDADVAGAAVQYEGAPAIQVVTRDASERRATERAREASEQRLRDLLDSVGLLAITVDGDGCVTFANRATHELVGVAAGSLVGASAFELLWFPDPADAQTSLRAAVAAGMITPQAELDFVIPGDATPGRVRRRVRWHLSLLRDDEDRPTGVAAIGEDVTDARATTDRLGAVLATAPVGICAVDLAGRIRYADGGPFARQSTLGSAARWASLDDLPEAVAGIMARALAGAPGEALVEIEGRLYEASARPVEGPEAGAIAILVEVTERARLERDRHRLATAIDQATDAIVITDRDGRISYVNPAFERVSGYGIEEAIGSTPRILKSGVQTDAFYAAMWQTLLDGRAWSGELLNRAKDGALFREEATITPVRDESGVIVSFVAVKRDVTRLRALENALEAEVRERAAIVTALERIDRTGSVHEVAEAISQEMSRVSGVDIGIVVMVDGDDLVPVALAGPRALPIEIERPIPPARGAYLRARAEHGAWAEPWQVRPEDGIYGERMARAGLEGAAYVPLRSNGRLMGLLVLGTTRRAEVDGLVERLPSLVALGTVASSLLADGMRARATVAGERRSIEEIIEGGLFRPVYQPVIDLQTGEALGFEALTRFANGERPDLVFRRAADAGLGMRLEEVTLAAAIAGAGALPSSAFLSLNVSPGLLVRSKALAGVLRMVTRPVVLEVTEHAQIDDYGALREAARRLPIPIRLAVDDAGAGFASLRHVLELAPDIVKIDHSIVTGIDGDPTRQALVAGLRFFASRRSIQLIAEGVETPSELATLSALSIPLGQGFLLGRPVPAGVAAGSDAVFGGLGVPEALGPGARGATRSRSVTGPGRAPGHERRGNGTTHGAAGRNGTVRSGEVPVRLGEADGSNGEPRRG